MPAPPSFLRRISPQLLLAAALFFLILSDGAILRAYRALDFPRWITTADDFISGRFYLAAIPTGIALLALHRPLARRLILIAFPLQFIIVHALKHLIGRVRPCAAGDPLLFTGPSFVHVSFPSGHAAAVWTVSLLLCRFFPRLRLAWIVAALAVCFARFHADAHFLSDLLAGAFLAFAAVDAAARLTTPTMSAAIRGVPPEARALRAWVPSRLSNPLLTISSILLPALLIFTFNISTHRNLLPPIDSSQAAQAITSMYRTLLNREPDPPGLDSYVDMLTDDRSLMEPFKSIALSPEFRIEMLRFLPETRTDEIYRRLLGRTPTPDESNHALALFAQPDDDGHDIRTLILRLTISRECLDRLRALPLSP